MSCRIAVQSATRHTNIEFPTFFVKKILEKILTNRKDASILPKITVEDLRQTA